MTDVLLAAVSILAMVGTRLSFFFPMWLFMNYIKEHFLVFFVFCYSGESSI